MQDPDQSIGQSSKRLMMRLASLAEPVVVVAGAGRARQGAKSPLVAGIGEPPIAGQAGEHHPAGARRLGDGRAARIVLSRFRMGEAGSVVTEFR